MSRKMKGRNEYSGYGRPPRSRDPGVRRRRRRGGRKVIHYTLLLIFLMAAGVTLSLTTLFKVERVLVVGTDKYPPAEIVAASGIQVGENLFRVDAAAVREALLGEFPYIETVDIRRKLPPAIELRVTQSMPAAAVLEDGVVTFITADGKVLEQGALFIPENIPVVKGLPVNGTKPGEILCDEADEGLKMLRYLFEALDTADSFGPVTNVDISNPLNMKIVYQNRYLLHMGTEADLNYKLDFISEIINGDPPDAQARIDVSNARDKRAFVKRVSLAEALRLEEAPDRQTDRLFDNGFAGPDENTENSS